MMLTFNNIKFNSIGDNEMRKLGFQDISENLWLYVKRIDTRYAKRVDINYSFNLCLDKNLKDFSGEIVNEDTGNAIDVTYFFRNGLPLYYPDDVVIERFLSVELNRFKNAGLVSEVNLSDGNDE